VTKACIPHLLEHEVDGWWLHSVQVHTQVVDNWAPSTVQVDFQLHLCPVLECSDEVLIDPNPWPSHFSHPRNQSCIPLTVFLCGPSLHIGLCRILVWNPSIVLCNPSLLMMMGPWGIQLYCIESNLHCPGFSILASL